MSPYVRKFVAGETPVAPTIVRPRGKESPPATPAPVPAPPSRPTRIESVDILRGIVMVIMALDHVRDFLMNPHFDPTDLTQTTAAIFLTRWITHYCAPVFVFLAGTGAFLSASRGKSTGDLSRFLWTRGLMLVVFEFTIVRWGWLFNFGMSQLFVQVIWAIGVSMICLAALIHLPKWAIATFGIVMVAGHNLLDGIAPESFGSLGWLWGVLHVSRIFPLSGGVALFPLYPLIPWIGVMAAGYAFGAIMLYEPGRRVKTLFRLGVGLTVGFIVIRALNVYGDLVPWTAQKDGLFTFFSFLNTTKYPPSLDYLLMTLGPSILALALLEKGAGKVGQFFIVYGRVPMFYYIVHLYLVHAVTVIAGAVQGYGFSPFFDLWLGFPQAYGYGLPVVYVVWCVVVLALYPACRWYGKLKQTRKSVWMSYI